MKAIAAMDENRGIGKNGTIPWKVSADFKWFKEFTVGKNLVVGHSTFLSLPPLKERDIYFISRPKAKTPDEIPMGDYGYHTNSHGTLGRRLCYYTDVIYGISFVDILTGYESNCKIEDPIIAGGAKTYELFLPYITEFYVTHIKGSYDADVFMCDFEGFFPNKQLIRELDGGHKIVKYFK